MTKQQMVKLANEALANLNWDGCLTPEEEQMGWTVGQALQHRANLARYALLQIVREPAPSDNLFPSVER
jgi:hypothetical protein